MEKSITFNAQMVSAILAGKKTVTRRPMREHQCRYVRGDYLWVREPPDMLSCGITLLVLCVSAERLNWTTELDARREGFDSLEELREAWDTIYAEGMRWDTNPMVWRIEFEVVK